MRIDACRGIQDTWLISGFQGFRGFRVFQGILGIWEYTLVEGIKIFELFQGFQGFECFESFRGFHGLEIFNANAGFYFWYEFATLLLFRVSSVSRDSRDLGYTFVEGF